MRLAAALGLALAPLFSSAAFAGTLTPEDRTRLSVALETISLDWNEAAVGVANDVFLDPQYGSAEFREYFAWFFSAHGFPEPLQNYLTYPTFHWFGDDVHRKLQEALAPVLAARSDVLFRRHVQNPLELEVDPTLRDTSWYTLAFLARIGHLGGQLSEGSRSAAYAMLRELVADHPDVLSAAHAIDLGRTPSLALLRAQLHQTLRDIEASDAAQLVEDLGLEGAYADLLLRHGILLLDNRGLDARQLGVLGELLDMIPAELRGLSHISVFETLGNPTDQNGFYRYLTLGASSGVNISAIRVDAALENQFPSDVAPHSVPVFCSALQHELNHDVDRVAVGAVPVLQARELELIRRAGDEPLNYLRSMFAPGVFLNAPQEFFASIANEYFADSFHTLELGLHRFEQGWNEPINQFLFFAEVYAQGGATTRFYELDAEGNYAVRTVPVQRDVWGHIDRLAWQGVEYQFVLDPAGNVTELGPAQSRVVEVPVRSGGDDLSEVLSRGKVSSNGDLPFAGGFLAAMRFADVSVPRGARVRSAFLKLVPRKRSDRPIRVVYRAEAADDSEPIGTERGALSSLPKTAARVTEEPPSWRAGTSVASADLAPVIQEIVDRDGWSAGNALTVFVAPAERSRWSRLVTSYGSSPSAAPVLVVEYTP